MYNINRLKKEIDSNSIYEQCRKNKKDFTRNRKLTPKDCIIRQEIYSQMMVYNIMQSIVNDLENEI